MATQQEIKQTIAVLVAAYPSQSRMDEGAMRQFLRILERTLEPYPASVLHALVHPRTGLISTAVHFPTLAEVKRWCDACWDKQDPRIDARAIAGPAGRISGPAATEPSEDQRKAVLDQFRALINELKTTTAMQNAKR